MYVRRNIDANKVRPRRSTDRRSNVLLVIIARNEVEEADWHSIDDPEESTSENEKRRRTNFILKPSVFFVGGGSSNSYVIFRAGISIMSTDPLVWVHI